VMIAIALASRRAADSDEAAASPPPPPAPVAQAAVQPIAVEPPPEVVIDEPPPPPAIDPAPPAPAKKPKPRPVKAVKKQPDPPPPAPETIDAAGVLAKFKSMSRDYREFKSAYGSRLDGEWTDLATFAQYANKSPDKLKELDRKLDRFRSLMRAQK